MELLIQSLSSQINGILVCVDMSGFGWSQLRKFGPGQARKVIHILDQCLPIRIKNILVVHESTLTDIGYTILRPFMSEELHSKILFLGTNVDQLHERVPRRWLPREFGGDLGPMDSTAWFEQLVQDDARQCLMNERKGPYGFMVSTLNGTNGDEHQVKCVSTAGAICRGRYSEIDSGDVKNLFRKSQTCNGYLFDYFNTSTSVD